jgi:hypothetical protein
VHGLEKPEHIDDDLHLWHPEKVVEWVSTAERIGVPFYVALPTYGYEVIFDEEGAFAGLRAGEEERVWPRGHTRRVVFAEPEDVLGVIDRLEMRRLRSMIGYSWFRMPVGGDDMAWPWGTFDAVCSGRMPEWKFSAEVRNPEKGLWEVWLSNDGETHGQRDVALAIRWRGCALEVYDTLGGFRIERGNASPGELRIVGKAPPLGGPVPAAWLRTSSTRDQGGAIDVSEVELR